MRNGGGGLLKKLVSRDTWLPETHAQPEPTQYQQFMLHADSTERFSVVSFVWGPGQATPIQNHTVWGLIGMLRGAEPTIRQRGRLPSPVHWAIPDIPERLDAAADLAFHRPVVSARLAVDITRICTHYAALGERWAFLESLATSRQLATQSGKDARSRTRLWPRSLKLPSATSPRRSSVETQAPGVHQVCRPFTHDVRTAGPQKFRPGALQK